MNLDESMRVHARQAAEVLGEDATWHFRDGSPDRAVRVVIDRQLLQPVNSMGEPVAAVRAARVFVPRRPASAGGLLNVRMGDEITLRARIGSNPERCRVTEILEEDDGGFLVQVMR